MASSFKFVTREVMMILLGVIKLSMFVVKD